MVEARGDAGLASVVQDEGLRDRPRRLDSDRDRQRPDDGEAPGRRSHPPDGGDQSGDAGEADQPHDTFGRRVRKEEEERDHRERERADESDRPSPVGLAANQQRDGGDREEHEDHIERSDERRSQIEAFEVRAVDVNQQQILEPERQPDDQGRHEHVPDRVEVERGRLALRCAGGRRRQRVDPCLGISRVSGCQEPL